ncbi:MAG: hypothetical protein ACQET1_00775 [Gemmatimonadota bacterium]
MWGDGQALDSLVRTAFVVVGDVGRHGATKVVFGQEDEGVWLRGMVGLPPSFSPPPGPHAIPAPLGRGTLVCGILAKVCYSLGPTKLPALLAALD